MALLAAGAALADLLPAWAAALAIVALPAAGFRLGRQAGQTAAQPAVPAAPAPGPRSDSILAQLPDPAILVDGGGNVLEANAAARTWLPNLAAGRPLTQALRSPDILDGIAAAVAAGVPQELLYRERVPAERLFELRILPTPRQSGPGRDAFLLFRDMTAARRLEQMRVDFVANASHELRTPLASVLGFIETLQGPAKDDRVARERFLEVMRGQAERMRRLVDDLLSLSRIEQREHVAPTTAVDLKSLVQEVLEPLRRLAGQSQVEIAFAAPDGPATVLGDRDELIRLIENLVENAVKYGESGKRVELTLAVLDRIELSVRDFGPGIAAEDVPRLTERFYRVNLAESRAKGGTGLGLAIVKHIVNRHRGTLAIESELGRGTVVRVQFPRAPTG
jgi:two-component system phosphate regulon sensor histidine kinase PhoR